MRIIFSSGQRARKGHEKGLRRGKEEKNQQDTDRWGWGKSIPESGTFSKPWCLMVHFKLVRVNAMSTPIVFNPYPWNLQKILLSSQMICTVGFLSFFFFFKWNSNRRLCFKCRVLWGYRVWKQEPRKHESWEMAESLRRALNISGHCWVSVLLGLLPT